VAVAQVEEPVLENSHVSGFCAALTFDTLILRQAQDEGESSAKPFFTMTLILSLSKDEGAARSQTDVLHKCSKCDRGRHLNRAFLPPLFFPSRLVENRDRRGMFEWPADLRNGSVQKGPDRKIPMMRCNEARHFPFRSNAMSAAIGELNSTLRSF
jgi:hypothetical protein